jgi:hypothetical protein
LEEAAAILAVMQQNRIEDSEQLAYACVTGGTATPDGQLWLREYAERELQRMGVSHLFEIVSVGRVNEREGRMMEVKETTFELNEWLETLLRIQTDDPKRFASFSPLLKISVSIYSQQKAKAKTEKRIKAA